MLKLPDFIVVKVLVSNDKNVNVLREQTVAVSNIHRIRPWFNTGSHGVAIELPMTSMQLKEGLSLDPKSDSKKITKTLLLQEDWEKLNEIIGAVVISK